MSLSDWINVSLCILSFILAAISVVTVVVTLKQNQKMIENSTRPYVVVKYEAIQYAKEIVRYVVVKNYGQTGATITELHYSGTMTEIFQEQFQHLKGAFLAPSQSILYFFGNINTGEPEVLQIRYTYADTTGKTYSEDIKLHMITGRMVDRSYQGITEPFIQLAMLEHML